MPWKLFECEDLGG